MASFAKNVAPKTRVLDIGSLDVNGTYRELFNHCNYTGIDITAGRNVDIVVPPYNYPFPPESWPVIISGSTLEHVRHPWRWMPEIARILEPGGIVIIIVPWMHEFHEYPVDCWRVFPDGLRALFEDSGLQIIKTEMYRERDQHDTLGVAIKPKTIRSPDLETHEAKKYSAGLPEINLEPQILHHQSAQSAPTPARIRQGYATHTHPAAISFLLPANLAAY